MNSDLFILRGFEGFSGGWLLISQQDVAKARRSPLSQCRLVVQGLIQLYAHARLVVWIPGTQVCSLVRLQLCYCV